MPELESRSGRQFERHRIDAERTADELEPRTGSEQAKNAVTQEEEAGHDVVGADMLGNRRHERPYRPRVTCQRVTQDGPLALAASAATDGTHGYQARSPLPSWPTVFALQGRLPVLEPIAHWHPTSFEPARGFRVPARKVRGLKPIAHLLVQLERPKRFLLYRRFPLQAIGRS